MKKTIAPYVLLPLLIAVKVFCSDDPSYDDSPVLVADSTGTIILGGKARVTIRPPGFYSIQTQILKIAGQLQLTHGQSHGSGGGPYHIGMFEVVGTNWKENLDHHKGWSLYLSTDNVANSYDSKIGSTDKETFYLVNGDATGTPTQYNFLLDQTGPDAPKLVRPGGPITKIALMVDDGGGYHTVSPPASGYTAPDPGKWKITIHYCKKKPNSDGSCPAS